MGMSFGSKEASKLNGSDKGIVGLRQSHWVSNQQNFVDEHVEESSNGNSLDEVGLIDDEKSLDDVDLTDDEKADNGVFLLDLCLCSCLILCLFSKKKKKKEKMSNKGKCSSCS